MTIESTPAVEAETKRASIVHKVVGLAEQLRIGAEEVRIHLDADRIHHSDAIMQAINVLLTKGDGLKIDIRQEPIEGAYGSNVVGIDIVCRRKAD
ncbi:hypothetical protein D9M69_523460 [compost metagenome]